ncbi:MAG: aldo/keto reductase [Streptosporangiales bacterium]|nr:aldo/keto reductase [Streptosporangiales bacterium]
MSLGLGTAPLGGLYAPVDDETAEATVRAALDAGLTYVDTAPHYGLGVAERRLGAVLGRLPRDSFVLSTKVGRLLRPRPPGQGPDAGEVFSEAPPLTRVWDWTRDGIRRCLEESLDRLGLDRVDAVYLHDPDDHEREVYETAYPALAELRAEGTVRAIGAGMNQSEMLTRFVHRLDLDVVLLAGRYTLLDQTGADELLPACAERGVAVVMGGVYNSGLLAGSGVGRAKYNYADAPPALVERALRLRDACARHGVPLRAAALRFPFGHPVVRCVLVGPRSAEEVADNLRCYRHPIPGELWDELAGEGLIPPEFLPKSPPSPSRSMLWGPQIRQTGPTT